MTNEEIRVKIVSELGWGEVGPGMIDPTRDWNAAGEVIATMRERGFEFRCAADCFDAPASVFGAQFVNMEVSFESFEATFPLAVCKAALAAISATKAV